MKLDSIGGRRFIFACAGLVSATGLQAIGMLDHGGTAYASTIIFLGGILTGGNLVQRHIESKGGTQ